MRIILYIAVFIASLSVDAAAATGRERLTLIIVIDGLSHHQLMANREKLSAGGIRSLMQKGAVFENTHYGTAATYTASGHATIVTGVHPNKHGMIANRWFDRAAAEKVYCVADKRYPLLNGYGDRAKGRSPLKLKSKTIGDVSQRRVFAVSHKDRSAIISAGVRGKAFFYDDDSGRFLTSTYYYKEYPGWWRQKYGSLGRSGAGEEHFFGFLRSGITFLGKAHRKIRPHLSDRQMTLFAEELIEGEAIGKGREGDMLILSYSMLDSINHRHGPDSRRARHYFKKLDREIGFLLAMIDRKIGLDHTLIVFTADHGFALRPRTKVFGTGTGGRINIDVMADSLNEYLAEQTGVEEIVRGYAVPFIYLNRDKLRQKNISAVEVEKLAVEYLQGQDGIKTVYTPAHIRQIRKNAPKVDQMIKKAWFEGRSGDLYIVPKRDWILTKEKYKSGTNHGSPYNYDTHVPLIIAGPGIDGGFYPGMVDMTDIAPTLASYYDIRLGEADGMSLWDLIKKDTDGSA